MKNNLVLRQGDVLLVPVTEIPEIARKTNHKRGRLILAEGEATGHYHSIACSLDVDLFEMPSQRELFLLVKEGNALLEHQEHAKISVPQGKYRVIIQREFDPSGDRKVTD